MSQKNAQLSCSFFNYKPVPENGPLNKAPKFLTDIHYIARQKKRKVVSLCTTSSRTTQGKLGLRSLVCQIRGSIGRYGANHGTVLGRLLSHFGRLLSHPKFQEHCGIARKMTKFFGSFLFFPNIQSISLSHTFIFQSKIYSKCPK